MFVIPGIVLLVIFILARPQELVPALQRVPFLYLAAGFAAFGYVVDLRLRRLAPTGANTLPWVGAFFAWALMSTGINAPDALPRATVDFVILFVLYGLIAHGVQRFRTLQLVLGTLALTCVFIALVCFEQGLARNQCVGGTGTVGDVFGKPDGRPCERHYECVTDEAEPGLDYRCERVGVLGTYSIDDRVRYVGELNDPNEVALAIAAAGIALLIGFAARRRGSAMQLPIAASIALLFATVILTQSRGGLVAALLVPAVYIVRRYGLAAVLPALVVALPLLMVGGRSGGSATTSTLNRYEAWAAGLYMFKASPLYGVGARMYTEHHYLTAHNSYVLALAELGVVGLFLFVTILYLTVKTLIVGVRELVAVPGAEVAQVWGMALLSGWAGILFQINTLSFAYHSVLWLCIGLVGAWASAVRHHRPAFAIRMTARDLAIVAVVTFGYGFVALPAYLKYKGFL